jgi:hypothetical protein
VSLSKQKRYEYHAANFRSVALALDQVERLGKDAIRKNDESATVTATRLYALLLAAALETRLLKLLHETRVRDADRTRVLSASSQRDRWAEAITSGFQHHYRVAPSQELEAKLDTTPRYRLTVLLQVVDTELRPLIEIRNTRAHGQWFYAFNHDLDALNTDLMRALNTENLRGLQHKREIAKAFANTVQDLLVSDTTFERDFDSHFKEIERRRHQLTRDDYEGYVAFLRRRHERRHRYLKSGS